jgi:mitochondrial chaperone BCS1
MIEFEKLFSPDNAVFQGGFGLAMIALGAQAMRFGSSFAMNLARKHLLISLEVTSKDRAYPWVLQWVTAQGTRTQHLSVETALKSINSHTSDTIFNLVPGPGYHFIFFRNHFLGRFLLILLLLSRPS